MPNQTSTNQIDIKQINFSVTNSAILLTLSLIALIIYLYFANHNVFIDYQTRDQINLTILICGAIFFVVGYILCIFQTIIIKNFSWTAYLNLVPFFFSIPAIIFCITETKKMKNSTII